MTRPAVAGLAVLLTLACGNEPSLSTEAQVYEVVAVDSEFTQSLALNGRPALVVSNLEPQASVIRGDYGRVAGLGADRSTIAALAAIADTPGQVPSDLQRSKRVRVISEARVQPGFTEQFPGHRGVVRVSQIGFNSSQTEAVVLAVLDCGPLCSHADIFVLRQSNRQWRVVGRGQSWIS